VRRITFNSPAFFEEHLADIANGFGQEIAPLVLRTEQDQLDQALTHLCDQLRQIDNVLSFNVLSHQLVYLAMQAALRGALGTLPTSTALRYLAAG
jgi:hypothetical protein